MKKVSTAVTLVFGIFAFPAFGAGTNPVVSDGEANTAMGTDALTASFNKTSSCDGCIFNNTGGGYSALHSMTSGQDNTAFGYGAMSSANNTSENSAFGTDALIYNTGQNNSAFGSAALLYNSTGSQQVAVGTQALYENVTGSQNTAVGYASMAFAQDGNNNTAVGYNALWNNASGSNNIAIGSEAGANIVTGSGNVDIASLGAAGDSGVIRIGTSGKQHETFIQAIWTKSVGSNYGTVVVNPSGQLGMITSSERYKTDVKSLDLSDAAVADLRPVTFHLKTDPTGPLQYGLIAEEVNKIFPDLVIYNDQGGIEGIRYEQLTPILLKSVQDYQAKLTLYEKKAIANETKIAALEERAAKAEVQNARIERQLATLQAQIAASTPGGAMVAAR
jgi:hypothetical protein